MQKFVGIFAVRDEFEDDVGMVVERVSEAAVYFLPVGQVE